MNSLKPIQFRYMVCICLLVLCACGGDDASSSEVIDNAEDSISIGGDICIDACSRLDTCSQAMCAQPLIDRNTCISDCQLDAVAFEAESLSRQSCGELNGALCLDSAVGSACDCEGDGREGVDCAGIFECFETCLVDDERCQRNCFTFASPQALEHYSSIASCAEIACNDLSTECIEKDCSFELNACLRNSGPRSFCLDGCELSDDQCGASQFCYAYTDGGVCAAGNPSNATVPVDSTRCSRPDECGAHQQCVLSEGN